MGRHFGLNSNNPEGSSSHTLPMLVKPMQKRRAKERQRHAPNRASLPDNMGQMVLSANTDFKLPKKMQDKKPLALEENTFPEAGQNHYNAAS